MSKTRRGTLIVVTLPVLITAAWLPFRASAQGRGMGRAAQSGGMQGMSANDSAHMAAVADHAMSGSMDDAMMKHMELTPHRPGTAADSARAMKIAAELKRAIAKYRDTAAAVADGYRMFLPGVKNQKVYHFTNNRRALAAAFHFDAAKPTSILYKRGDDGALHLVGAMYTMPKAASYDRLDDRVPLAVARWHKHVNWCMPKKGEMSRWMETRDGKPLFGPESPIATKAECDAVHGTFYPSLFGWMIHANVFEGTDAATIWGDDHGSSGHEHKM